MRILQVHNFHRFGGGSDTVARNTCQLLAAAGHQVRLFERDSRQLSGFAGRWRAFAGGFYAREAVQEFNNILETWKPEVVHVQEVYPLISPFIFRSCRRAGIPVVMTCHNYFMTCPVLTHVRNHQPCTACLDTNVWACLRYNCRGNLSESFAYAARSQWARTLHLLDPVQLFLAPSDFMRQWLITRGGVAPEKVQTVGNPVFEPAAKIAYHPQSRNYIAYAGRFSTEKGVDVLLKASIEAGVPLRLAGDHQGFEPENYPANLVQFMGELRGDEYERFLDGARVVVIPSISNETFSLVCAESLIRGVPVVASRIGALQELVRENMNGLLVPPGDIQALAQALTSLWNDPATCERMSAQGLKDMEYHYPNRYIQRLEEAYQKAVSTNLQS